MDTNIIKADPTYRNRLLFTLAMLLLMGVVFFYYMSAYFQKILTLSETDSMLAMEMMRQFLHYASITNGLVTAIFFILINSLTLRILASKQFPPPGMRVIRDTKIVTGRNALFRAGLLFTVSLLILATNAVFFILFSFIDTLA